MTDTIVSPATEDQNDSAPVVHSDLKALREAKGLSLQDIFESTRISVTNLKAIENAQYQLLPAPVFARTFIRSYAQVIGAESDILLASYEQYLQSVNAPPAQEKETGRAWLKPCGHGKRIFWIVSAALAAIVVMFLLYYNRPGPEIAATPTAPPVQTAPGMKPEVQPEIPKPSPDMKPEVQPETPKPVSEKKYHIFMEASEPVWIRIQADRNLPEQMILQAGETLERFVDEPFTLDIGNAGGIAITFQGKSIGNIGKRGQVVHLRLPED
jgi:cytoskeleton protein RodZ